MAIQINDFSIVNNGTQLNIELTASLGYTITHVKLWTMDNFKDYTKAISLNYKLLQTNNVENFIVTNTELELSSFEDILFLEVETDEPTTICPTCLIPALGITYNLTSYYNCFLKEILEMNIKECENCNNLSTKDLVLTLSILLDSIEPSIDLGFYNQAIMNVNKLKKLCSLKNCDNCKKIECSKCGNFKQTI